MCSKADETFVIVEKLFKSSYLFAFLRHYHGPPSAVVVDLGLGKSGLDYIAALSEYSVPYYWQCC